MKCYELVITKSVFIEAESSSEAIDKFLKIRKDSLEQVMEVNELEDEDE